VRRGSCLRAVGSGTSVGLELPAISLDFLVAVGYTVGVAWEINATKQAETWLLEIDQDAFEQIAAAIDELEEHGPSLGRPLVDRIKTSRHHNMKELRSIGGSIRILFAFDPQREAILLIGGDKAGNWKGWYEENVPVADALYDKHLENTP
jgi:hypothetical protein